MNTDKKQQSPERQRQEQDRQSQPRRPQDLESQVEQKGSETGFTNPSSPAPSAKRKRRAVDEAFAGTSTRGPCSASMIARISAPVRTSSSRHASSASSGMNSMKRTT